MPRSMPKHREDLAQAIEERQAMAAQQSAVIMALLEQNTQLTERVRDLSERIAKLTTEVHGKVMPSA